MTTLQEYIETTGRRLTLEWALIEGENDNPETAHKLGKLITRDYQMRRDMVHINVIPLNPTGGYAGSPSGRTRVNRFIEILEKEYGISTTPRVRRGIDIDAGCGQLKSKIQKKEQQELSADKAELRSFIESSSPPLVGVYEDDSQDDHDDDETPTNELVDFSIDESAVDFEDEDWEDPEFDSELEHQEAARLISLVQNTVVPMSLLDTPDQKSKTTSITDDDAVQKAKRRRKKLLKNIKAIRKLREREESGLPLNDEQLAKIACEAEWNAELESLEHNLQ
jgi:hypothetical protein